MIGDFKASEYGKSKTTDVEGTGNVGYQRLEPVFDYIDKLKDEYIIVENMLDGKYKKDIIKLMF